MKVTLNIKFAICRISVSMKQSCPETKKSVSFSSKKCVINTFPVIQWDAFRNTKVLSIKQQRLKNLLSKEGQHKRTLAVKILFALKKLNPVYLFVDWGFKVAPLILVKQCSSYGGQTLCLLQKWAHFGESIVWSYDLMFLWQPCFQKVFHHF